MARLISRLLKLETYKFYAHFYIGIFILNFTFLEKISRGCRIIKMSTFLRYRKHIHIDFFYFLNGHFFSFRNVSELLCV